ncbi:PH domain-containing protein [Chloropicon primus]|uniref:PDK1-type PH domain-containing protein n=2 Tax=Chloropicon primus TaxID=1764295 RepID=A0A5B8MQF0_9CHLO|nr:hypothetical protein A3770_09p54460 [Chloropicon primus]UPR02152.1 PH domain-containing protein [Chloropicon primus]|eukprot:QDZ22928.1 hypothetical protein A3770_09p54460 [Chloropicon primus]
MAHSAGSEYLKGVLEDGEAVVRFGEVTKRKAGIATGAFTCQKRLLVLTSKPRLLYFCVDSKVFKGELDEVVTCYKKTETKFVVKTTKKERIFETGEDTGDQSADAWCTQIRFDFAGTEHYGSRY